MSFHWLTSHDKFSSCSVHFGDFQSLYIVCLTTYINLSVSFFQSFNNIMLIKHSKFTSFSHDLKIIRTSLKCCFTQQSFIIVAIINIFINCCMMQQSRKDSHLFTISCFDFGLKSKRKCIKVKINSILPSLAVCKPWRKIFSKKSAFVGFV